MKILLGDFGCVVRLF